MLVVDKADSAPEVSTPQCSEHAIEPCLAFERRLLKHWSKALSLPPEIILLLQSEPAFKYLAPFFEIDRRIQRVGGSLEIALSPEGKITQRLLTTPANLETLWKETFALLPEGIEALPQHNLREALLDYDRLPRDLTKYSPRRLAREILRVIRDELFPTFISGLIGQSGLPVGRGSPGYDLRCAREQQRAEEVQVKIMRPDSPLLSPSSEKGKKQRWKLGTLLRTDSAGLGADPRLLLVNEGARPQQVSWLLGELHKAEVPPERVLVLERSQLESFGIGVCCRTPNDQAGPSETFLRINLQQYLKAHLAASLMHRSEHDFNQASRDALVELLSLGGRTQEEAGRMADTALRGGSLEYQLLKARGIWEIKEILENQMKPALRVA